MTTIELELINQLQIALKNMIDRYRSNTFFTTHMIVSECLAIFPDIKEPKWALRKLVCRPYFYLDDTKGWQISYSISLLDNTSSLTREGTNK
jgi:hypothetical protein